jgi:hypothetical protein
MFAGEDAARQGVEAVRDAGVIVEQLFVLELEAFGLGGVLRSCGSSRPAVIRRGKRSSK